MSKHASIFRVILMASAAPFIGITAAHAQPGYAPAPAPAAPPAPAAAPGGAPPPAPAAPAPAATDPSAAAAPVPAQPAPGYYPPPGYAAPSPYAPPPGYYPPPGYAQPGYYPPPVYYPPQPAGPPPGYHEHDGFYMRLTMGLTVLNASWKESETDYTINGGGMAMGMAFGGSVTPNLVLFGEFTGSVAMEPTRKINGASNTYTNHDVSLFGIGPGVAYYLVPANLYFSGTLAFSKLSDSLHNSSSSSNDSVDMTDYGIGGTFVIGKEWWVSTNWGLGVAGQLHVASMKVKGGDSRASAEAISILFSATYN